MDIDGGWNFLMGAIQQLLLAEIPSSGAPYGPAVTWNPSDKGAGVTLSGSNLIATTVNGYTVRATAAAPTGVSICEITLGASTSSQSCALGIADSSASLASWLGHDAHGYQLLQANGNIYYNNLLNINNAYGVIPVGDIIGMKIDNGAGTVKFYINGVLLCTLTHGLGGTIYAAASVSIDNNVTAAVTANFGATAFAYTY